MMTVTIDIPALDRLCAILESQDKAGLAQAIEEEIVGKLKEAAKGDTLRRAAKAPTPACERCADYVTTKETAPEPRKEAQETPKPEPTEKPDAPAEAKPAAKPVAIVTLADVQKAAAQMRDDGKLEAVKALFPEFGIRKLSDLKGDALQGFAARLRGMGAAI